MPSDRGPESTTLESAETARHRQIRAEQIRLIFSSAAPVTIFGLLTATALVHIQWDLIGHRILTAWLASHAVSCLAWCLLAFRFLRGDPNERTAGFWCKVVGVSSGLTGMFWGSAAFLLYPDARPLNQVLLLLVLSCVMLAGVSWLAPRREAFVLYFLPVGISAAIRLIMDSDQYHVIIGIAAAVFTASVLINTWQIHATVLRSLTLQFENADLLSGLLRAKQETEALNRELETRVAERTTELHEANQRLRTEMEQRKQAEEDLLRVRKLESLGVLAGGIAHDFNNFLTIVLGNVGLAQMEVPAHSPLSGILAQIERACRRAGSLASQLLTFAKGGSPVRRTVSVVPMLEDVRSLTSAGSNVTISLEIEEGLWPAEIDVAQVSHALQNVLLNARQAMPDGGPIELRAENVYSGRDSVPLAPGRFIRISVRDRGPGIPPEVLPRIFDPYFTTKENGSGLGLAAAYAIVSSHRGHISVHSELGAGAAFHVYLPASEQPQGAEFSSEGDLPAGSGRVLIMDDEETIREAAVRTLQKSGYRVVAVADGAAAVAEFAAARSAGDGFECVILDLTVPGGMGGKDAALRLREIDRSVPLVVSSGYSSNPVMAEFRNHGFDAVLEKPWSVAQLTQTVHRLAQARARVGA